MSVVHQLYFTHCTYGTSALERRHGEAAAEVAGYDVRASSLRGEELRKKYRQIQPFLIYGLPQFTPGEEKSRLDAATAPRRLFYYPSINGLRIVGQFCYRQTDASPQRRPDSKFGHVLFSDPGGEPWSVLTCLGLWEAPWVDADSPAHPFDLPQLSGPGDLLDRTAPAIDDWVLRSFLTTPQGGTFLDPRDVIPARWKNKPPAQRVELLTSILQAYLNVACEERREGVLLVAEPGLAALLFYGVARLLPPGNIREEISFSTYEPKIDRLNVALAATTLHDPERNDLRPEVYEGPGFVCNTFLGKTSKRALAARAYPRLVFDALLNKGWDEVDLLLGQFQTANPKRPDDLEQLTKTQALVPLILQPHAPLPDMSWRQSEVASAYLAAAVRQQLADGPGSLPRLKELVNSDKHLLLLELLAGEKGTDDDQFAVNYLVRNLPDTLLPLVLTSRRIGRRYKAGALADYVNRTQRFPEGCDALWQEANSASGSSTTVGQAILPAVLMGIQESVYPNLLRGLFSTPHFLPFAVALVQASRRDPAKMGLIAWVIEQIDDERLCALLSRCRQEVDANYPWQETPLGDRLARLLNGLPQNPEFFEERLDVVSAWAENFFDQEQVDKLTAWQDVHRSLRALRAADGSKRAGSGKSGTFSAPKTGDPGAAAKTMADGIWKAMDADHYPDDERGTRKQQCLRELGQMIVQRRDFLPMQVWIAIGDYFRDKRRIGTHAKFRVAAAKKKEQGGGWWFWGILLVVVGAVAGAGLLVMLGNRGEPVAKSDGKDKERDSRDAKKKGKGPIAAKVEEPESTDPPGKEEPKEKATKEPVKKPTKAPEKKPVKEPEKQPEKEPAKPSEEEKPKKTNKEPAEQPNKEPPKTPQESPKTKPALRAEAGMDLVVFGPNTKMPNEGKPLFKLTKVGDNPKLILHGLDFANKHPAEPKDLKLNVLSDPNKPLELGVALKKPDKVTVVVWFIIDRDNTTVRYTYTKNTFDEGEPARLSALRHCVLEVKGDKGSQAIALREPLLIDKPLALNYGAAQISGAPLEYDLFLGQGTIYCGASMDAAKTRTYYDFGEGANEVRSHKCAALAKKYRVPDILVNLDKIATNQGKNGLLVVCVQASGGEATEEQKSGDLRRKRLEEISRILSANNDKITKIERHAQGTTNPGSREKAVDALAVVTGIKRPERPEKKNYPVNEKWQQAYNQYMRNIRENFVVEARKIAEETGKASENLAKEQKKLQDEETAASKGTPVGKLMNDLKGISVVLYRMVHGIRVDTVIIKELSDVPVSSNPKDLDLRGAGEK